MDRKKADEAANELAGVAPLLDDAGLTVLALAARDLMDRLEAVLDGSDFLRGDDE